MVLAKTLFRDAKNILSNVILIKQMLLFDKFHAYRAAL